MSRLEHYTFNITPGRVTEVEADTILVPGHPGRTGSGGVFGGVQQAGAIAGCEVLGNWHTQSFSDAPMGAVLRAEAGGGKSKYISHVVTVSDFAHGAKDNFCAVVAAVANALEEMHQAGLKSVSMPMMGTGQMGWLTEEQSARAMLIGIDRFAKRFPDARLTVNFCMKDEARAVVMREVLAKPELYTDISENAILGERGKRVPDMADVGFYVSDREPLMMKLSQSQRTSAEGMHR